MSLASRLGLLALAAVACIVLNERDFAATDPRDATRAAVAQFGGGEPAANVGAAAAQHHWRVLASVAGLVLLGAFLFLEDAERWWRRAQQR
jgi:hypothetical protein